MCSVLICTHLLSYKRAIDYILWKDAMEQDRFAANNKLYIIGLIALLLTLFLFFFSIYILPYLIWSLNYDVPDFVSSMVAYFEDDLRYTPLNSKILTWLIFFVPGFITGYISYYISNNIDNKILGTKKSPEPELTELETRQSKIINDTQSRDSYMLAGRIIILMIVIVAVILLLEQLVLLTS